MADLNSWVSDKLHELVGISDRSIAEFMVGLCKKSKSPSEFVDKIRDTGTIDVDDKVGWSLYCFGFNAHIPNSPPLPLMALRSRTGFLVAFFNIYSGLVRCLYSLASCGTDFPDSKAQERNGERRTGRGRRRPSICSTRTVSSVLLKVMMMSCP